MSGECWNWTGNISSQGYARAGQKFAYRIIYEFVFGQIPKGLQLDHLCRNRKCVNPDHLEPVTCKINVLRGESPAAQNAKKTHCKSGHPLDGENLKKTHNRRICKECDRQSSRKYWRKKKNE
jgi:hypothetical protein